MPLKELKVKIFEEITLLAKAMSDENRVKIATLIQREGSLCVCEICDTLKLSQPLVSRHLKQLKAADILTSNREGKWIIYNIVNNPSSVLVTYLTVMKQKEDILDKLIQCTAR
jgi:ArsR family transcriptional regulator